ncbi:MAG: bifunctional riboflavin kinase/FAD synthetase [Chloroflexota bacterium]
MADSIRLSIEPPLSAPPSSSVVTIGVFDGVHLGHQKLIGAAVSRARELGTRATAITFDPHPRQVVAKNGTVQYLSSLAERKAVIRGLGVDTVVTLHFSEEVAALSAEDFLGEIRTKLGLIELWVGPDFALGRGRQGTVPVLERIGGQMGFSVHTVPAALTAEGVVISSSTIRRLVMEGDVAAANEMLGRPYALAGPVISGDRRGRLLGFPTANLTLSPLRVTPANGVYIVSALTQEGRFSAVANIGVRPSFGENTRGLEVHILDFSGDIYGQMLRVEFLQRLRPEMRFASADELQRQIQQDVAMARTYLQTEARPH